MIILKKIWKREVVTAQDLILPFDIEEGLYVSLKMKKKR